MYKNIIMNKNKKNQEIELKLDLINAENHKKLLNLLCANKTLRQINYFFDSKDYILRSHLLALRIRTEGEINILTVKGPKKNISDIVIRDEYEVIISKDLKESFLDRGIMISQHSEITPLKYLEDKITSLDSPLCNFLQFSNTRIVSEIGSIQVELDETEYENNKKSYELEVEFDSCLENESYVAELKDFFSDNNIPWQIAKKSKFARAIENIS